MGLLEQAAFALQERPATGQFQPQAPWHVMRAAYTERFRSSLMALISIFLRPMVTDGDQTSERDAHGRVVRGGVVWLKSAEDKGKCSRRRRGRKEGKTRWFQASVAGGRRAGSWGVRRVTRYMSVWLRDTLDESLDAQREALGSDAEG